MIGSINDDIINLEELSMVLLDYLLNNYRAELFKRYDVYEQHSDNVSEERIAPGCVKLTFDKHVYYDGNSAVYRGYLFLEKDGSGTWRITKESDTTTDYNLSRKGR